MAQELAPINGRGKNVTFHELAAFIGISHEAIRSDVKLGCPIVSMGNQQTNEPTIINSYEWHNWKLARARTQRGGNTRISGGEGNGTDPKDRMLEATASKREVELAKMRNELFPIVDLGMLLDDELATIRTAILGTEEHVRELVGMEGARAVQDYLITVVNRAVEGMDDVTEEMDHRA